MANNISVILLAAGLSLRMGQPKLLMPWDGTTVLGKVVSIFATAGLDEIIVVTGGNHEQVENEVVRLAKEFPVRFIYNPQHAQGEMLGSIQAGLATLASKPSAALIGLGDQPQVRVETIERICTVFGQTRAPLVIPSYQNRRGHPWLVIQSLWPAIMSLPFSTNPRKFLESYSSQVKYIAADQSILLDLDTPEDYACQRP
jgi:molybdenum cofactor cytidylyltransferase